MALFTSLLLLLVAIFLSKISVSIGFKLLDAIKSHYGS